MARKEPYSKTITLKKATWQGFAVALLFVIIEATTQWLNSAEGEGTLVPLIGAIGAGLVAAAAKAFINWLKNRDRPLDYSRLP